MAGLSLVCAKSFVSWHQLNLDGSLGVRDVVCVSTCSLTLFIVAVVKAGSVSCMLKAVDSSPVQSFRSDAAPLEKR